jgi:DNA-binding transcriptional LysR family regulator
MEVICQVNIHSFDLNLLLALDALLQEQHVTRAAARVGLSQPAMSNALARLRELLDDPLLVRTPKGMVPTPRALRLQGAVREALQAVERAVADSEAFAPERAQAGFDLMTSDAIGMLLLPRLGERLRAAAPGIALRVHALIEDEPWEGLESGRTHLAVGVYEERPAGIHQRPLYEEQFVCLMRLDHPAAAERLSLRRYVELPHIRVSTTRSGWGSSAVDRTLERHGVSRHIGITLPHFLVAPFIVAQSDYVITFPSRLAAYFARLLPLRVVAPPLEIPGYTIRLCWHERMQREPACAWLREQIQAIAESIPGLAQPTPQVGGAQRAPGRQRRGARVAAK